MAETEEFVGRIARSIARKRPHIEYPAKALDQLAAGIQRVQVAVLVEPVFVDSPHARLASVVQVSHSVDRVGAFGKGRRRVDEVLAISAHLLHRVQHGFGVMVDPYQIVANGLRFGPLFELDEHVRRRPVAGIDAAQHHIHPFGTVRQLVLEEHLDMAKTGIHDVGEKCGQAVLPRPDLAGADARLVLDAGLFGQHGVQFVSPGILEQRLGTLPNESHRYSPTRAREQHVRVGTSTK